MEFLWNLYGIRMVHQAHLARAAGQQHSGNTLAIREFGQTGTASRKTPMNEPTGPISNALCPLSYLSFLAAVLAGFETG